MLDTIVLKQKVGKKEFKRKLPKLRRELRMLQQQLREQGIPLIVLFEGWDGAGKGEIIKSLVKRLDPRGYKVWPISAPLREEALRPFLWRFWRKTPAEGRMAVFDRSWYGRVLLERIDRRVKKAQWNIAYQEIKHLERQLSDHGTVIVKFLLHISKKEQKKRLKAMEKDPLLKWKVSKEDWKHHRQYDKYYKAYDEALEKTSTHYAPWSIVEATDLRFAQLKVFEELIAAARLAVERSQQQLTAKTPPVKAGAARAGTARAGTARAGAAEAGAAKAGASGGLRWMAKLDRKTILDEVDLSLALDKGSYKKRLAKLQVELRDWEYKLFKKRVPLIVLYEGWDAAGKGGNIKRMTENLDPRGFDVVPVTAPSEEEKSHHHLWRFWRDIPKAGHMCIFDRSWYGRVLVERIEGFCSELQWRRAFQEIREFERMLVRAGVVLVKFWIHISKEEQLRRFKAREADPYKSYKLTEEDWRNRSKWEQYEEAVVDTLNRCSTSYAPWTIIEGNDKYWARVKTIETVIKALEDAL